MKSVTVAVTIVTFNSAQFIARCLEHVFRQDYPLLNVIVIDNASSDETPDILRGFADRVRFVPNQENRGFAGGQNQAIALSDSDWVLVLNPDVVLNPSFVTKALQPVALDDRVGSVSGKLLRMQPAETLDSTGIYFTPSLRHFDRGSGEPDSDAYDHFEFVFGVTGAAALYRREMINDVAVNREFFDEQFFAYREDADLAWRAQLLGWKCLYVPDAVAYHVRKVLPTNRKSLPADINMHSVKNRFLMRIKNIDAGLYLRYFLPITLRDILVFGGCLLTETSSLRAFPIVLRTFPAMLRKRKEIMRRRRVDSRYMSAWFSNEPVSHPAPDIDRVVGASGILSR